MNITGILTAAAVVGIVGIFVGVFLGIAGLLFKVKVDEKEEAVDMPAVPDLRLQSRRERHRSMPVLSAEKQ